VQPTTDYQKDLLTEKQVWDLYRLTIPWQRRARRERRGPRYFKLGKMVRYRRSDMEAYFALHAVEPNGGREAAPPIGSVSEL
jgi:predicted DNA-binding transcriptional regulator AlpA